MYQGEKRTGNPNPTPQKTQKTKKEQNNNKTTIQNELLQMVILSESIHVPIMACCMCKICVTQYFLSSNLFLHNCETSNA